MNSKRVSHPIFIASILLFLWVPSTSRAAVADFCWAGFFLPASSQDPDVTAENVYPVFEQFFDTFENKKSGAVFSFLKSLEWDEMNYHGYVGVTREGSEKRLQQMENLANTYGFFLTIDQVMPFDPDEVTVFHKTFKTYAAYIFGALNLFNMKTRNLIYCRPFFIIYKGEKKLSPVKMIEFGLDRFSEKLANPSDKFTLKMQKDIQDYFGGKGEQKEALRMATGELKNTYGVMPVCKRCVRTTEEDMSEASKGRLRTFARYFFNVKMAEFKQVVPVSEKHGQIQDAVHSFTVRTKEGDVRFSKTSFAGYDGSGQTLLTVNIPEPANKVKLGLRYVVKKTAIAENAFRKKYSTVLDICVQRDKTGKKEICALPNLFEKVITGSRKTSDVYYFNSLVNAVSSLDGETF